ncbi:MAG: hypothetical protein LRY68_05105 [Sulfurospirillum sp.]|nr:hypothetical protein [Sulfurospirillum sp.]
MICRGLWGEHLWFDGKSYHLMDANAKALRSFCESFEIPVEWVIQGLADSLDVERFFKGKLCDSYGDWYMDTRLFLAN